MTKHSLIAFERGLQSLHVHQPNRPEVRRPTSTRCPGVRSDRELPRFVGIVKASLDLILFPFTLGKQTFNKQVNVKCIIDSRRQNEVQVGPDKLEVVASSATWATCFLLVEALK